MGSQVDGWWAPALAAAGTLGPAWSEQDFYDYLRHGQSPRHGVAGGPMAPVIAELAELPDEDVRAMAHYLSSLGHETAASPQSNAQGNAQAVRLERLAQTQAASLAPNRGARHSRPPARSAMSRARSRVRPAPFARRQQRRTRARSRQPDPHHPARRQQPAIPRARDHARLCQALSDEQVADIVAHVRQRFAPDRPAWQNIADSVRRARAHQ
jgi:nicotinate dehydrogenase subunit B